MFVGRARGLLAGLALFAAACGDGTGPLNPGIGSPASVLIVSGDGQTGLVGTALSVPLKVKVTNNGGAAITGATVAFTVTSGTGSVTPKSAVTDASGTASTTLTLGGTSGDVKVTATVQGTTLSVTFSATAGTGTIVTACTAGSLQTPTVGAVLAGVSGTGVCLGGGTTGAEYAIAAFNTNLDSSLASVGFTVKGTGITSVIAADVIADGLSASRTSASVSPIFASADRRTTSVRRAFDMQLRETAVRELSWRIPAARAAMAATTSATRARFDVIPSTVTVGQVLRLNANGLSACDTDRAIYIGARVVSISNSAIIVADTMNPPTNGFTKSDYDAFAARFDTLVNPLDVNAFGAPTDIDKNGKVLILFTKEVNKLTPRGSSGYIGGFFFERDLFPTRTQGDFQGCAASNFGEIFYVMAPDSLAVYGDQRKKSDVFKNTTGTIAHEYQHLINAGRRMYVNDALDFESTWLNEGLSHIAEELLYYRVSGHAPRQNLGATEITASQAQIDAFNEYQSDNLGRFQIFLDHPAQTNVHGDNDSLETRGATWSLLRYLADHQGSSDGTVWQQLVNGKLSGLQNLASVFGAGYVTSMRDWATTIFSDDIPGVTDARFLEPSWNMRSIFPRLCANSSCSVRLGVYPLSVTSLSNGVGSPQSVAAGGVSFIRFGVPAGSQGSIDWSQSGLPVSSLMQFTVVRTK